MNQKKDNRIPFDWELYQKGYEVEYRVGGKPLRIEHFHEAQRNSKIVSINYDGEVITHRINGMYSSVPMCDLDLLLIPPQPKPEKPYTKNEIINFALEAITRHDELAETNTSGKIFQSGDKWITINELFDECFNNNRPIG